MIGWTRRNRGGRSNRPEDPREVAKLVAVSLGTYLLCVAALVLARLYL